MKRIATTLVLGSLIVATSALAASNFDSAIPDQRTNYDKRLVGSSYADAHANDPVPASLTGSAIPDQSQPSDFMPSESSYADAHKNDPVPASLAGTAIPDERYGYDLRLTGTIDADTNLQNSAAQGEAQSGGAE
jgi:hypothetical protein